MAAEKDVNPLVTGGSLLVAGFGSCAAHASGLESGATFVSEIRAGTGFKLADRRRERGHGLVCDRAGFYSAAANTCTMLSVPTDSHDVETGLNPGGTCVLEFALRTVVGSAFTDPFQFRFLAAPGQA